MHHHHEGQVLPGNFSSSCHTITLDATHDLIAYCRLSNGAYKLSSVDLDNCLANIDGEFRWERDGHFGATARNARLVEDGRVMEAELEMGAHKGWKLARVQLDERISNENGDLIFLH